MKRYNCVVILVLCASTFLLSQEALFQETNLDQVYDQFEMDGTGVIVAVMDRGIDYTHPDFQNADGTTRILGIFDLSTDEGASDPDNPYAAGTIHTEDEINAALQSGTLITRDAVGHGTVTAGVATGNGAASEGRILGVAPNASIVVVKFTSEGAPVHGDQEAETPFFRPQYLDQAIDFVESIAEQENMPFVMGANFGSAGSSADGTSIACQTIDDHFDGVPGQVFLTGSSDDGGIVNHAQIQLSNGNTESMRFVNADGRLRFRAWYSDQDEINVRITLADGSIFNHSSPSNESDLVQEIQPTHNFFHNGSDVDFDVADNDKREILIDFIAAPGEIEIEFIADNITNGQLVAWLNPSAIFSGSENFFLNHVVPGYTVWDWATASSNVGFNSYILNDGWVDINGVPRDGLPGNEAGVGNLWPGSGVGPVLEGAEGITISVPGNTNYGAYTQHGLWNTLDFLLIEGEEREYGIIEAVSGANPVLLGVVALLLQADPTLDASEVKQILGETARSDSQTGVVPNDEWGFGKLDALAAVRRVLGISSTDNFEEDAFSISPNPTTGLLNIPDNMGDQKDYIIYNSIGQTMQSGTIQDNKVDVTTLQGGFYQMSLIDKGRIIGSTRFVKE